MLPNYTKNFSGLSYSYTQGGGFAGGDNYIWAKGERIDLSNANKIYKTGHNDVTPYNFNINLLVKI